MIPIENRLEMLFAEDQELMMENAHRHIVNTGGRVLLTALIPEGWLLIGWAPAAVVDHLREIAPQLGFQVSSLEEVEVS